jgi:hypothetical protein
MPKFNGNQKAILKAVCLIFWGLLLMLGVMDLFVHRLIYDVMGHPTNYATAVVLVSLCYLYSTEYKVTDKITFLLLLSIGILSGRSKFYGFCALSVFIILFFSSTKQFKWSFMNIFILTCMVAAMVFVTWGKIHLYFYQAVTDEVEKDMIARYVLYITTPDIFRDYFPFGSGLASYATYSSGLFYSHIYTEYGIDGVWGISKNYYNFISDTYYPSLAQFGVAGVILYVSFWIYVLKKALSSFMQRRNAHYFTIVILIVGFLAIEGIACSTFIGNVGLFAMMLLGMTLANMKTEAIAETCETQQ